MQHGTVTASNGRVLLVDDEPSIRRAYARLLDQAGFEVVTAESGAVALEQIARASFDALLTDIMMPDMNGCELVEQVRKTGSRIPVVLMTGAPSVESAVLAVNTGAIAYLTKPVPSSQLIETILRAVESGGLTHFTPDEEGSLIARAITESTLAFQPIISVKDGSVVAYEALLRPQTAGMETPAELIHRAEACGMLDALGHHVREAAAAAVETLPAKTSLYINLHPTDLLDPDIYLPDTRLGRVAQRVVLELTERAALEDIPELNERIEQLRALGYRIAIDDLGAGYSSLSSLVSLEPEIVKLDMGLVRDIHINDRKRTLVQALTVLAASLGITVVAEGVEAPEERDVLARLRVPMLQGFYFARPSAFFAPVPPDRMRSGARRRRVSRVARPPSGRQRA